MKPIRLVLSGILALCLLGVLPPAGQAQDAAPDSGFFVYRGDAGWWACDHDPCSYDAPAVSGRMVAGDFDGDFVAEIAALYDYGSANSSIHVWQSTKSSFSDWTTWWSCASANCYQSAPAQGRFVSGDFNGDGKDDIAAMYDYGSSESVLHVWLSTESGFVYQGNDGWWKCGPNCYDASNVTGRMVAGDFNGDGKDDIAAMYDYGGPSDSALHVWLSTGSAFVPQGENNRGWWRCGPGCYAASAVTDRFVAGDFDGDGKDDIAAMYEYGDGKSTLHVWLSTGSALTYQGNDGWWKCDRTGCYYGAPAVTGRLVSGDFDLDGKADIAALYNYEFGNSRLHVWLSTGSSFDYQGDSGWWRSSANSYPATDVTGRLVAGDFDGAGRADIAALRDYGGYHARLHVWTAHIWAHAPYTYLPMIVRE